MKSAVDFAFDFGANRFSLNILCLQYVMSYFARFLAPGISDTLALALTATEPRDFSSPEFGGKILRL